MKKLCFFFLVLMCGSSHVFAQEQQDKPSNQWTLQECIEYANRNNLQVKQSELGLMSSKVELERSKANLYPTLNSGGGYTYSVGRSIDPWTNAVVDEPIRSQNYFLSTDVDLFAGFSKQNTIKQNKADLRASEFELADTRNNITLQIITAYTNILFNRELLANAENRLRASELQKERTRKQVEVGTLPQASLYELEAQYASDELAVTNAYNNLELARLNLTQLLQLPADEAINIVVPDLEVDNVQEYPISAQEVYQIAEETQPVIKAADARIESSDYGVEAAKGSLYPRLSLGGSLSSAYSSAAPDYLPKEGAEMVPEYDESGIPVGYILTPDEGRTHVYGVRQNYSEYEKATYFDQLDYNLRRQVSVNLNIPIFNGYSARSAVSRARIASDQAKLQSKIVRQQLRQTIEQAAQDVKAAALTYRSNLNQVRSLREAFRSAEQRFNLGATNAVDYNIAKTNLDVAESNLIRAKYDYIFKNKILDFYLNKPLSFN